MARISCSNVPGRRPRSTKGWIAYEMVDGMVDMGHAANLGDFALDVARRLVVRRVHLLSGWNCTPERVFRALQMLESSEFEWEDLVSHRVSLSRLGEGLEAMEDGYRLDGREIVRVVVTPWE